MRQLCSSLLHKFPGFITVSCWIKLNALKNAFGIFAKISPTAGAGMSWSTRLRAAFTSGGGEPWSTSSGRFLLPQFELARQILKDPYNFDFLTLGKEAQERDLEAALLSHLREFLLELGVGFAFVGSQYHLEVGDQDFLYRSSILPPESALLCGHRPEDL